MKLFGKDLNKDIALIAEIGVNHEGDVKAAAKMIELAAHAGADAVKLQSYTPENFISREDPDRLARVTRFGLSLDDHFALAETAKRCGISLFSSAITEDWVPHLSRFGVIKIASGDIDFEPVIRAAAASGSQVIISTGTATVPEIDRAVFWVRDEVGEEQLPERLAILHCVSAYPTPLDQANLLAIPFLSERYNPVTIGYSNHVMGTEAAIASVALGARIVEMHFTDQKEGRTFHDHKLSADPDDLAYLAKILPQIAASRGDYGKTVQECESGNVKAIRKGLLANRDLKAGEILKEEDLRFARPATEFAAHDLASLIGKRMLNDVKDGFVLKRSDMDLEG